MKEKRRKGFTLAELLIVVAIIAVLIAIAIPIFVGRLNEAREATCKANRRSLYGQVVTEHILSDRPYSEVFEEYVGSAGKCPSGGEFSWVNSGDTGTIICSYHDDGGVSGSGSESDSESNPALHMTPITDENSFQRGTVLQDETGTCILTTHLYYMWLDYKGGATVKQLTEMYSQNALPVDPTNIKDSSSSSELKPGDLYRDEDGTYYYVDKVSISEDPPNDSWITLLQ